MNQALFIDTGEQSVIHSQGGNKLFSSVLLKCAFYPPVAIPIFLRAHLKNQERWRISTHSSRQEPFTARKEAKWRNPDYPVFTWFCKGLRFSETKLKFNLKVWTHQMAGKCQFRTGEQTQGRGRLASKGEWILTQSPRGGGRQRSPETEQSAPGHLCAEAEGHAQAWTGGCSYEGKHRIVDRGKKQPRNTGFWCKCFFQQ